MIEIKDLSAAYGPVQAVRSATCSIDDGTIVTVIGANGAGKSTLAETICGFHRPSAGSVTVDGIGLGGLSTTAVARRRVRLVPQERRVFGNCTVAEHFALVHSPRGKQPLRDTILDLFPRLSERWHVRAKQLSGGEQQILSLARAALVDPRVIVLDEATEGLAPKTIDAVVDLIKTMRDRGTIVLLMEQAGPFAHSVGDRTLSMDRGILT